MDELETQIRMVVQIARCIHLKRVLTITNPEPHLNFWRLMHGALLDLSVLEWTKIFGSNAEPTHWKGMISDHAKFKSDLLTCVGCTEVEWSNYWDEMKGYRDEYVAHHSASPSKTQYPTLDWAIKSCYFYYSHLIARARATGERRFPNDLEEYCKRFAAQASEIANAANRATASYQELVF